MLCSASSLQELSSLSSLHSPPDELMPQLVVKGRRNNGDLKHPSPGMLSLFAQLATAPMRPNSCNRPQVTTNSSNSQAPICARDNNVDDPDWKGLRQTGDLKSEPVPSQSPYCSSPRILAFNVPSSDREKLSSQILASSPATPSLTAANSPIALLSAVSSSRLMPACFLRPVVKNGAAPRNSLLLRCKIKRHGVYVWCVVCVCVWRGGTGGVGQGWREEGGRGGGGEGDGWKGGRREEVVAVAVAVVTCD